MITVAEFIVFTIAICAHVGFLGILYAWENSHTVRTLRFVCILFTLWVVGEFVSAQVPDVTVRVWIQRATGAVGLSTSLAFTRFAYALRYKKYDGFFYGFFAVVGISALAYLATDLGIRSVANHLGMHRVNFGVLFWPITSISLINWLFNVWVMYRAMQELPGYETARKASITLIQLAATVLPVMGILGLLWSAVFWEKNLFFRYAPLLTTVFIGFVSLAFFRYGFLTTGIERLARDLFYNALDGIVITDESGIVRQINPRALQLLNVEREIAEGIPLKQLLYLSDDIPPGRRFSRAPGDIPGLRHHIAVSVSDVASHMGIQQSMLVLVDMTDEKNAEEAASKSRDELEHEILLRTEELIELQEKEAVGAMAGSIAHDFNNLLAAVLGFATAARRDVAGDSPLKRDLDEILSSARQARAVVQQLLLFSRRQKSKRQRMDVGELIQSALPLIASSLPPNVQLSHVIPDKAFHIMANRTDLSQVLMNLCTNAVQAMAEKEGTIGVTLEADAAYGDVGTDSGASATIYVGEKVEHANIKISVSDSGPGISDEMKPLVFEPFFSTRENAIGFGLPTASRIAIENSGGISIEDNEPCGAIVSIWLPRLTVDEMADVSAGVDLTGGEHIMVVDDDARLLRLMVRLLTSAGYRATTFADSQAALTAFRRTPGAFDLVVTDYVMPDLSGAELGQLILDERSDTPVILISGNATDEQVTAARAEGVCAYLSKPFTREEFLQVIRDTLNDSNRTATAP